MDNLIFCSDDSNRNFILQKNTVYILQSIQVSTTFVSCVSTKLDRPQKKFQSSSSKIFLPYIFLGFWKIKEFQNQNIKVALVIAKTNFQKRTRK